MDPLGISVPLQHVIYRRHQLLRLYSVAEGGTNELAALMEWRSQGKSVTIRRKRVSVSLYPPQIPHGLVWDWTWNSVARGRGLRVRCMARPKVLYQNLNFIIGNLGYELKTNICSKGFLVIQRKRFLTARFLCVYTGQSKVAQPSVAHKNVLILAYNTIMKLNNCNK